MTMALSGPPADEAVLVGMSTGDDAGVYRVSDDLALVVTADYITPPIDDPFAFGQIAAANALSDVYAMGGEPRVALNLCVFPRELHSDVAQEILMGARDKVSEAGAHVVGGHTVRGPELLFGLSVTGVVRPERVLRNVGALPGDALLLTKPLGTGLLIGGLRKGLCSHSDLADAILGMATLNQGAARAIRELPVHAATDVTGFGLVGHALGMIQDRLALRISLSRLPLYPLALALARQGVTCAGARANRAAYAGRVDLTVPVENAQEELVYDPQTSGGLLLAIEPDHAERALAALAAAGVPSAHIGEFTADAPRISIVE